MGKYKNHWYYWYTGHKYIAVSSMILSTVIMWFLLVMAAGFSIWGIVTALLLDAVGFWLAILYLFVLRDSVTDLFGLQDKADIFVFEQLVIPVFAGFIVSRISTLIVVWVSEG